VAEAVGDEGALYVGELVVRVIVGTQGCQGRSPVVAEVLSEVEESFGGAKVRVMSGALRYLLAADPVLLVSKGQISGVDLTLLHVIQRWVRGAEVGVRLTVMQAAPKVKAWEREELASREMVYSAGGGASRRQ
jgi:hypothetical protein